MRERLVDRSHVRPRWATLMPDVLRRYAERVLEP